MRLAAGPKVCFRTTVARRVPSQASEWVGDTEILTLAGTLGPGLSHLHATIALADCRVIGDYLGPERLRDPQSQTG